MPLLIKTTRRFLLLFALALTLALPALADVSAGGASVERGDRVALTLPPEAGNAVWQCADSNVATVDKRGRVTGRRAGETTVTATAADGQCYVFSLAVTQPVSRVRLPESRLTLERGQTARLAPVVSPDDATDKTLTYISEDESVASVSADGLVTALKAGKTYITVSASNGKKDKLRLTVTQPVTEISFSESGVIVGRGERVKMPAAVFPADATDKSVRYDVEDRAVASVSSGGHITGKTAGETWVIARASNGLEARLRVTVTQPVTRVHLPSSMKLDSGASYQLQPEIAPDNATNRALAFSSSDESVAVVDGNGLVTALRAGKTTITATASSGKKDEMRLTVTQPVTGLTISDGDFILDRDDSRRLSAVVGPADASDKKIRWSSSNESVARVSSSGKVTGRAPGVAVITAAASNGLTASCAVTVVQPVTRVTLNASHLKLSRNNAARLEATIRPANATDQRLFWSSSNPAVASVEQDGTVRALADGSCVITATAASGKNASVKLTVTSVKVTGLSIGRFYAYPRVGDQYQLDAAVQPADATEKRVWYASSDPAVVSVDESGLVTALQEGQAAIAVASAEGGFVIWRLVTVRAPGQKRLEGVTIGINPGHQTKADTTQDPIAPGASKTRNRVGVGTTGNVTRTPEYEVNLQVSLKLRDLLESEGATVVMTRTANDVYITNIQRAMMLNSAQVDLALQIHCDGSDNRSSHGVSMWVCDKGAYSDISAEAGHCLMLAMLERTGARNAGEYRSGNYMSLNYSTTPSVLVEMGYLSNAAEEQKLISDSYQQLLAEGMFNGICNWLGR